MNAKSLAQRFIDAGYPCEIEAGPRGIVIYASSKRDVDAIARDILGAVRSRDPRALITTQGQHDDSGDEPAATSWWSSIDFDWNKFGGT